MLVSKADLNSAVDDATVVWALKRQLIAIYDSLNIKKPKSTPFIYVSCQISIKEKLKTPTLSLTKSLKSCSLFPLSI